MRKVKSKHKYALRCNMCNRGWTVILDDPTSADLLNSVHEHKQYPQCYGIEVCYVGENVSEYSR